MMSEKEGKPKKHATRPDRFPEPYLFSVFVKCCGNLHKMIGQKGCPTQYGTLKRYAERYDWRNRYAQEMENRNRAAEKMRTQNHLKRLDRLHLLEDLMDKELLPTKDEEGNLMWGLKPVSWEALMQRRLALAKQLEVMAGHPTDRKEIVQIVMMQVRVVCEVIGQVVQEFVNEGAIEQGVAKRLAGEFANRVNSLDLRIVKPEQLGEKAS